MRGTVWLRVFAFVFLPFAVFAVLQAIYFSSTHEQSLNTAMREKATAVAHLATHSVAASMDFDDQVTIREVFEGLAEDTDFLYVAIFDHRGGQYAQYNPNRLDLSEVPRGYRATHWGLWRGGFVINTPCLLYTSPSPRDS